MPAQATLRPVDPPTVKAMLADGDELALIDLREELIFSRNHLLWARSVPLSAGWSCASRGWCRAATPASCCATTAMAWSSAPPKCSPTPATPTSSYLEGGVAAWEKAGFELFSGVNVPSKAFGEYIEHACETPSVSRRGARQR